MMLTKTLVFLVSKKKKQKNHIPLDLIILRRIIFDKTTIA